MCEQCRRHSVYQSETGCAATGYSTGFARNGRLAWISRSVKNRPAIRKLGIVFGEVSETLIETSANGWFGNVVPALSDSIGNAIDSEVGSWQPYKNQLDP